MRHVKRKQERVFEHEHVVLEFRSAHLHLAQNITTELDVLEQQIHDETAHDFETRLLGKWFLGIRRLGFLVGTVIGIVCVFPTVATLRSLFLRSLLVLALRFALPITASDASSVDQPY